MPITVNTSPILQPQGVAGTATSPAQAGAGDDSPFAALLAMLASQIGATPVVPASNVKPDADAVVDDNSNAANATTNDANAQPEFVLQLPPTPWADPEMPVPVRGVTISGDVPEMTTENGASLLPEPAGPIAPSDVSPRPRAQPQQAMLASLPRAPFRPIAPAPNSNVVPLPVSRPGDAQAVAQTMPATVVALPKAPIPKISLKSVATPNLAKADTTTPPQVNTITSAPVGKPDARPMPSIMASIASAVKDATNVPVKRAPAVAANGAPAKPVRLVSCVTMTSLPPDEIAAPTYHGPDRRRQIEARPAQPDATTAKIEPTSVKPAPEAHDTAKTPAEVTQQDANARISPATASAATSFDAAPTTHNGPGITPVDATVSTPPVVQQQAPAQHADAALRLPERATTHGEVSPEIEALALRIASKSAQGAKRFDIRLDPPELGRIDVRLDVNHNGRAEAQLSADKPQTLDLLQRDHRSLERALKDAGLDLGSMSFSLKGEERQAMPQQSHQMQPAETAPSKPISNNDPAVIRASANADGRIDIRV